MAKPSAVPKLPLLCKADNVRDDDPSWLAAAPQSTGGERGGGGGRPAPRNVVVAASFSNSGSAHSGRKLQQHERTPRRTPRSQQRHGGGARQPLVFTSSTQTRYTLTPRSDADGAHDPAAAAAASSSAVALASTTPRALTPRDLHNIAAYVDANKRLSHRHRVGRASSVIPPAPFSKVREHCDPVLGLALAPVSAKESALDCPLRFSAPAELHAPQMSDPPPRKPLAARIVALLKGASSVPHHWPGERQGTERDVAHLNAIRDVETRVATARRAGQARKEAEAVFVLAALHYNAHNLERCVAALTTCAAVFERTLADATGTALCHNLLGVCRYRLGDPRGALAHHKRVEQLGGAFARGVAQLNLGVCFMALGSTEFAAQAFADAKTSALQAGDSVLETLAAGNLGIALMRAGDMRQAQANVEHCLEQCGIAGDKVGAAVCLLLLGEIFAAVNDFAHALFYYEHAFRVAVEAQCSDVAEVARVGVGIARGNEAMRTRIAQSAEQMGRPVGVEEVLALLPPAAGLQQQQQQEVEEVEEEAPDPA